MVGASPMTSLYSPSGGWWEFADCSVVVITSKFGNIVREFLIGFIQVSIVKSTLCMLQVRKGHVYKLRVGASKSWSASDLQTRCRLKEIRNVSLREPYKRRLRGWMPYSPPRLAESSDNSQS